LINIEFREKISIITILLVLLLIPGCTSKDIKKLDITPEEYLHGNLTLSLEPNKYFYNETEWMVFTISVKNIDRHIISVQPPVIGKNIIIYLINEKEGKRVFIPHVKNYDMGPIENNLLQPDYYIYSYEYSIKNYIFSHTNDTYYYKNINNYSGWECTLQAEYKPTIGFMEGYPYNKAWDDGLLLSNKTIFIIGNKS